ncbi:hypothetical protein L1856_07565 [Streptomyces sp. Tue 6430]|nr:hypothetical protein [Streptomyces sp. Tue 6430]
MPVVSASSPAPGPGGLPAVRRTAPRPGRLPAAHPTTPPPARPRRHGRRPVRREVLEHQGEHPVDEHGDPVTGTVAHGGRLAFRLGEQCRGLVVGRAPYLLGGARPHPAGLLARRGHDGLGLLFGRTAARGGGGLGPFAYAAGLLLRLFEPSQGRYEFGTEFGGTVRGDTARCGPARRGRRPEPRQEVPETRHTLSSE